MILAEHEGKQCDITPLIQLMYDGLINSLDWGSEFLDTEQKAAIVAVGVLIGGQMPEGDSNDIQASGWNEIGPAYPNVPHDPNHPAWKEWLVDHHAFNDRHKTHINKWYKEIGAQHLAQLMEDS